MLEYCYSLIWLLLEGMAGEKKERKESLGISNIFSHALMSIVYEDADM